MMKNKTIHSLVLNSEKSSHMQINTPLLSISSYSKPRLSLVEEVTNHWKDLKVHLLTNFLRR